MKHLFRLLICAFALWTLGGCDDTDYSGPAQFILYIEDAPADYETLNISILSVELFDGNVWHTAKTLTNSFNLLALTGGNMLRVAEITPPTGHYSKLRVTFDTDGIKLGNLKKSFPVYLSQQNAALTLDIDINLQNNVQTIAILDIQAAKSVKEPMPETFVFVPVASIFDISKMGVLRSMIVNMQNKPIPESMLVRAINNSSPDTTTSYTNSATGHIMLRLNQGIYKLIITPDSSSKYIPDTILNIAIEAGQPNILNSINLVSELPQ